VEPIPETRKVLEQLVSEGDDNVAVVLLRMGRRAREIVPECVGLSLGLLEENLTFTLVATSDEVAGLDAVQYLDGGPCVQAAWENEVADETAPQQPSNEERWQMYARSSAAAGIASSLTLPIQREGRVVGTVNLYAAAPHAFDQHHDELAAALGVSAENAIANADLSFDTRLEAVAAPERLADQNDIDIALGLIAEGQQVDIPLARERLRAAAARAGITEGQAARAVRGVFHT
jgi:GAF domain-containing protein